MKLTIAKAVVLCTLAFSLVLTGISAVDTSNTTVEVCHDGPHNDALYY